MDQFKALYEVTCPACGAENQIEFKDEKFSSRQVVSVECLQCRHGSEVFFSNEFEALEAFKSIGKFEAWTRKNYALHGVEDGCGSLEKMLRQARFIDKRREALEPEDRHLLVASVEVFNQLASRYVGRII